MAAAPIHGKAGAITFSNLTLGIKGWTLDYTSDTVDATDFVTAALGYRVFLAGISSWKATVKANFDPANTAVVNNAPAALTLTVSGDADFQGNAIMTSFKVSTSFDGIVEVDYEFQGTGALTVDTTP